MIVGIAGWRNRKTSSQTKVARLMLGRTGRVIPRQVDREVLGQALGEWRLHRSWLSDRFDPA
jgi:hypothetical protein